MVANLLLACAGACLSVASSTDTAIEAVDRILLSCEGTLVTGGQAGAASRIVTSGAVDLVHRWVYGFGLGGVPVVLVTRSEIDFTSPTIDGTLDRRTGRTTIALRSAPDASDVLMSMDLICRLSAPLS